MKKFTKVIALILSLTLLLCFPIGVSAAEPEDTGVDTAAKGSLTIYKVDMTNAEKDGAWDSSYVSTGVYDQNVNDTLNSYTLKDVEFTYLRVADVVQLTGSAADGADSDHVETLYGISKTAGADLLNALGLGNGANRYEKADGSDQLDDSKYYYQSDVLISALSTALKANATTVKNALEAYVTESGTAMPLTDTYGKTKAENLELGLYLVVETRVPEMVTSTCNPFFICLPMTSSGGSWIYDVTVYPKNLTGNPTLDKTLRESKDDTGKVYLKEEGWQDIKKAILYFRQAAEAGNPFAEYQLGRIYYFGNGVRADQEKGLEYLKGSAAHGNEYAANLLITIQQQHTWGVASCTASLIAQLGRIFQEQDQKQSQRQRPRMDRKHRREIEEKKQAMGIRD